MREEKGWIILQRPPYCLISKITIGMGGIGNIIKGNMTEEQDYLSDVSGIVRHLESWDGIIASTIKNYNTDMTELTKELKKLTDLVKECETKMENAKTKLQSRIQDAINQNNSMVRRFKDSKNRYKNQLSNMGICLDLEDNPAVPSEPNSMYEFLDATPGVEVSERTDEASGNKRKRKRKRYEEKQQE